MPQQLKLYTTSVIVRRWEESSNGRC